MKPSKMIQSMLCIFFALAVTQAHALSITPDNLESLTSWQGTDPINPNAEDIITLTGITGLNLLYKADVPEEGDPVDEDGDYYKDFYTTEFFNDATEPQEAVISWDGTIGDGTDNIATDEIFLLVKDGAAHEPVWYLYDIGIWNGTDNLDLSGFWPDQGAISHVSIFGGISTPVPEPATMLLFGTGLAGFVSYRIRRKKKA